MRFDSMMTRYRANHTHPINRATHAVGIPAIVASLPLMLFWPACGAGLFVLGLALQLIGHAFEGSAPSFVRDPRYIVVGAAWLVSAAWRAVRGRR